VFAPGGATTERTVTGEVVAIDGSHGEGGGQILRAAVVLSLATRRPFRMHSIRAGRDRPGLKAQHLHVLRAIRTLSASRVVGDREGSSDVSFFPEPMRGGSATVDVGTAGSITLLLQALIPAARLAAAPTELELIGGTDVRFSPPFDYFRHVLLPRMEGVTVELARRGFYPKGGGRVRVRVEPGPFAPVRAVERSRLKRISIYSTAHASLRGAEVAERQAKGARKPLSSYRAPIEEVIEYCDAFSVGTAVACAAEYQEGERLGADALGERGRPAEKVGQEAGERLAKEMQSGAPMDRHAADHWALWAALGGGGEIVASEVTEHTRTALWLCGQFLADEILSVRKSSFRAE
jgi:RNA 3'-phosphate cyclase